MDLRRLRAGEWIASASGAALLVSLFLPWYAIGAETRSAWESLSAVDVLLAFAAATAVLLAIATATQRVPAVPIALSALVTIVGLLAVLLVLGRLLDLPGDLDGREWALWLGLVSAAGIVVGGLIAMRDERLSAPGRHTDLTGRPTPPPPEIEAIPPPRPE